MDKEEFKKKFRRPMGAVLILLSGVEAKYFIFDVLDKFRAAHDTSISYSEKGIFLPSLTLLFGLLLLFGNDTFLKTLRTEDRKVTPIGWAFVAVVLLVMFGTNMWFDGEVKKLGYVSSDAMELRSVEKKSSGDESEEK